MKTLIVVLAYFMAIVVPLCAIYWFIIREYLLMRLHMELSRLHLAILSFGRAVESCPITQTEAARGVLSCLNFKADLEHLDLGDVLINTFEHPRHASLVSMDARITSENAEKIRQLQKRYSDLVMHAAIINSPVLFPIMGMLVLCADWSERASVWKERVYGGAIVAARVSSGMAIA